VPGGTLFRAQGQKGQFIEALLKPTGEVHVGRVEVPTALRGQGLAKDLYLRLADFARKSGLPRLEFQAGKNILNLPAVTKLRQAAIERFGGLGATAGALGNVQLPFEVAGQVGRVVQALTGKTGRAPTAEEIQLVTGAVPSKISLQHGGRVPDFSPIVDAASARHGVPAEIINAIIQTESSGRPRAVNPELASGGGKNPSTGLMQLRRTTAQALGYDPKNLFDPEVNINAGTEYLAKQFRRYGDWLSAIAAYNAGSARPVKGGKGEFRNQAYVNKVLKAIQR